MATAASSPPSPDLRPQNPPPDRGSGKLAAIASAARAHDVAALAELAQAPLGLVNDAARRQAWPILLGCAAASQTSAIPAAHIAPDPAHLPRHRDEAQVKLDVDRSFVYYPKGEGHKQLDQRKSELQNVITTTLRQYPFLCYFQGYHDIVQVLLLVLGPHAAPPAVARLSLLRIRDFMLPSLSAAVQHLSLLPCILRAADPQLERHVAVTQPFFALAATLTLYAHEIEDYDEIARLFDFLLATEASMSMYLFAATVLNRRHELLEVDRDEPEMMHAVLSKLPRPLALETLLAQALDLFRRYPPPRLPAGIWRQIDPDSVLKSTQDPQQVAAQSLQQGCDAFAKQAKRLRRRQIAHDARSLLWAYRRPATSLGVAVAIALASWYLQRHGVETADILRRVRFIWPR